MKKLGKFIQVSGVRISECPGRAKLVLVPFSCYIIGKAYNNGGSCKTHNRTPFAGPQA